MKTVGDYNLYLFEEKRQLCTQEGEGVMDGAIMKTDDTDRHFGSWCFKDNSQWLDETKKLREEKRTLERERRNLEQEKHLFEMKWRVLEEELMKLADEKQQVERQRNFYKYMSEQDSCSTEDLDTDVVRGDLFFVGVENVQSLKKRYKDLLKIYHPDNLNGDTETLQEINREYDKLKEKMH